MSDNPEFDYDAFPYGTKLIGPFVGQHKITVRDYRVPHLAAYSMHDGTWALTIDDRMSIECSDEELRRWVPFIADAMAVAAGYSCHGEQCQPMNRHKIKLTGISAGDVEP